MIALDIVGRGEPLVLLHGVGASRAIWRDVSGRLSADRTVLAPDIPGLGESPPVGEGFGLEETAGALGEALSQRVTGPYDLVGNSLGGAVAVIVARRRPDLVRRLVLVAPAGFSPRPSFVAGAVGRLSEPATAFRRIAGGALAGSGVARRVLLWGTIAAPQHLSTGSARAMFDGSRGSVRIGAAVTAVLECDLRPDLTTLDVPLGLIWGDRDRIVPIAAMQAILRVRPDAVVETIAGVAHVPHVERPGQFVAALGRVLARLET